MACLNLLAKLSTWCLPMLENPHTGDRRTPRIDYSQIAIEAKSWNGQIVVLAPENQEQTGRVVH